MLHHSTHITFCPLPWYFWKIHVDNVLLIFFNHVLPKFEVRPVSLDCRVEVDWLNAPHHKRKLLCWSADINSVTRYPHPSYSCRKPATQVAKWRDQGRNSQREQNGRWLPDAKLYKINHMSFYIKPFNLRENSSRGRTLNERLQDKFILSKILVKISPTSLPTGYYITRYNHFYCHSFTDEACPAKQATRLLIYAWTVFHSILW